MLRTLLLVTFSTLLIAQFGLCLPKPSSSESAERPNGRQRLEQLAYKNLLIYLNYGLQKSNQLVKDVLADPSMNNIDNDAMEQQKSVLRKYVQDSKKSLVATLPSNKNNHENRLVFACEKIVVLRSMSDFEPPFYSYTKGTPEEQIIWDALKKHGVLEYREELNNRTEEFMSNFADEVDNFMKTLSAAEKEEAKDMVEAWNRYTKHELGLSKIELGQRLFTILYDFDSHLRKST